MSADEITVSRERLHRALLRVLSPSMATRVLEDVERMPEPAPVPRPTETDRKRADHVLSRKFGKR